MNSDGSVNTTNTNPSLSSFSYLNGLGALTPDNYAFMPVKVEGVVTDAFRDEVSPDWNILTIESEGASIAVPNDGSNESRALKLLADNGLITLSETDDLYDLNHVAENPKKIELVELAAEQITHSLEDVNAAVINGNYALEAGLNPARDALIIEAADSNESYKYINYLVVKAGNEETAKTKALIAAFANQDVADFINKTYPGSVIPSADLVK